MTEQIRQPLPEVQAFIALRDKAESERIATVKELQKKYPLRDGWDGAATREYRDYQRDIRSAEEFYSSTVNDAWDTLKESSDPLVAWIAEHCWEYQVAASKIMAVLPATLEELDALADTMGWCAVWSSFRLDARNAGVLPGVPASSPERVALTNWIREELRMDANHYLELNDLLDAVEKVASAT